MSSIGSLTRYVHELRSPDSRLRDEAARIIWERFSPRLSNLVRRHLDNRIFRREDEQDVLQSMFASFCHSQSTGKTAPASREELWKLLVRITMCKVVNTAHRHMADRRDIRRERGDGPRDSSDPHSPKWMLDHVDRSQPSPEEQVCRCGRGSAPAQFASRPPPPDCRLEARRIHQRRDRLHDWQDGSLGGDEAPTNTKAPRG